MTQIDFFLIGLAHHHGPHRSVTGQKTMFPVSGGSLADKTTNRQLEEIIFCGLRGKRSQKQAGKQIKEKWIHKIVWN